MKTTVVLTTYNGSKYLMPLLDSLRCQSKKIDEVLICDDGSTDGTRDIVSEYIVKYDLRGWIKCWNSTNYGWMKNFRIGIQRAEGDIIFPCDQDDIWDKDKVKKMTMVMEENPEILLLSSDYKPLYEDGGHKVDDLTEIKGDRVEKIEFDTRFSIHERPGCVMAIRKSLVNMTKELWKDWYPHDAFLWTTACVLNGCYLLHEPLIQYRRHDSNASTGSQHIANAQVKSLDRTLNIVEWCFARNSLSKNEERILCKYQKYALMRKEFIEKKRIINWFKLIPHAGFYRSFRQQLGDWYYVIKR